MEFVDLCLEHFKSKFLVYDIFDFYINHVFPSERFVNAIPHI